MFANPHQSSPLVSFAFVHVSPSTPFVTVHLLKKELVGQSCNQNKDVQQYFKSQRNCQSVRNFAKSGHVVKDPISSPRFSRFIPETHEIPFAAFFLRMPLRLIARCC